MTAKIALVVAVSENGIIGRNGALPWRLPSDLKTFRRLTMGKPVVMGRRTFQSLKKPLDGRDNIVVTRDRTFAADGTLIAHSIDEALSIAREMARRRRADEVAVIGGAEIFAAVLPMADRAYWTIVHASIEGDTVMPALHPGEWKETAREPLTRSEKDEFAATLTILERNNAR
jgi:dihydrofolate reductase